MSLLIVQWRLEQCHQNHLGLPVPVIKYSLLPKKPKHFYFIGINIIGVRPRPMYASDVVTL